MGIGDGCEKARKTYAAIPMLWYEMHLCSLIGYEEGRAQPVLFHGYTLEEARSP
jgi:hypothetical protein